jgi:hypothetical protein
MHHGPNTPCRRRLREWSAGPTALAVFAVALFGHTWFVAERDQSHIGTGSTTVVRTASDLVYDLRNRSFSHSGHWNWCRYSHSFSLVRLNGIVEVIDGFTDDPPRQLDPQAEWFGVIWMRCPHPRPRGFWATTAIEWRHDVRDRTHLWGLMTAQELAETRATVVAVMERAAHCLDPSCSCQRAHALALLRAGDGVTRQRVWSGYIHNAVALALALLTLRAGFVTIRTTPRRIAVWRRSRRGRCTSCGYDLAGLGQPICPECGRERDVRR